MLRSSRSPASSQSRRKSILGAGLHHGAFTDSANALHPPPSHSPRRSAQFQPDGWHARGPALCALIMRTDLTPSRPDLTPILELRDIFKSFGTRKSFLRPRRLTVIDKV